VEAERYCNIDSVTVVGEVERMADYRRLDMVGFGMIPQEAPGGTSAENIDGKTFLEGFVARFFYFFGFFCSSNLQTLLYKRNSWETVNRSGGCRYMTSNDKERVDQQMHQKAGIRWEISKQKQTCRFIRETKKREGGTRPQ
jgi:hypothetical protein